MHTFKDMQGREWRIELTVGAVKRAKSLASVDLLDLKANPFLRFATDPALFVDALFAVLKPQADAAGVADADFGESLGGDTLQAAIEAFEKAYVDFFPRPEDRANARTVLNRTNQAFAVAGDRIAKRLEALDVPKTIDAEITRLMDGKSSGDAPASAA